MENFNKFLNELTTLEIKTEELYYYSGGVITEFNPAQQPGMNQKSDNFLSLSHNSQKSNYEVELGNLRELVESDLLSLSKDERMSRLRLLNKSNNVYEKFWAVYHNLYEKFYNGILTNTDLKLELTNLFKMPVFDSDIISEYFIIDLHDAIAIREGQLMLLNERMEEPEETNNSKTIEKKPIQPVRVLDFYKKQLELIEDEIQGIVNNWKIGKKKEECAAFCELLLENNFFPPGSKAKRIKSCNGFASHRYGNNIGNALKESQRLSREEKKEQFRKYFKKPTGV